MFLHVGLNAFPLCGGDDIFSGKADKENAAEGQKDNLIRAKLADFPVFFHFCYFDICNIIQTDKYKYQRMKLSRVI